MAYLGAFDANTVEPADFSALPTGDYTAIITDSEMRSTKNGSGQYLMLTFQIIEGKAKGRYVWHNLNLQNQNTKAEEIAQRELSAICHATGRLKISDSEQLHNIPIKIHVAYIPAKGEFPEKNQIKKWMKLGGGESPQPPMPPTAAPSRPAAPASPPPQKAQQSKEPPWKNKNKQAAAPAHLEGEPFDDDTPF